jgi:hypothetical protein
VFDGWKCTLALGEECGEVRGAFNSIEACATACSAAGHCNDDALNEWMAYCDRVFVFTSSGYDVPDSLCGAAADWVCTGPRPDPDYGEPGRSCWREDVGNVDSDEMRQMCAMTLLPNVTTLFCSVIL